MLAVALGIFTTLVPLVHPNVSTGYRGFAFTTAGITAISLTFRATQLRREGRAASRLLPAIGVIFGVAGTVLSLWSLAFFNAPSAVPAMSHLTFPSALSRQTDIPPEVIPKG